MVHALAETWRVLKPGGRLVDLRPYSTGWPLEVVTPDAALLAGPLDDSVGIDLDVACDEAIQEALDKGWFQPETEGRFEYTYYWDTVDEMHEYLKAEWKKSAAVPESVLCEAHRLVRLAGEPVQIRIRRTLILASYRKLA